jgi:hypothetical protein
MGRFFAMTPVMWKSVSLLFHKNFAKKDLRADAPGAKVCFCPDCFPPLLSTPGAKLFC